MCRRKTTDPLLGVFAKKGYTLLKNMRTGVEPLDAWIDMSGAGPWEPVGRLGSLLDSDLADLPVDTATDLDFENSQTEAIDVNVGLGFLAPFFALIGVPALSELRARVTGMKGAHMRVRATGVTERSISLGAVTQELDSRQIGASQAKLLTAARRIAFASHAVRTQGISVEITSKSGKSMNLGADFAFTANLDAGGHAKRESASVMNYAGTEPVTFGVRLYELVVDANRSVLRLDRAPGYDVLGSGKRVPKPPQPLLLDGSDGDLVADL